MSLRSLLSQHFNTARLSIYGSALLCTMISLSMAAKFAAVLSIDGLATFVPCAIVVCVLGVLLFVSLILSGFRKERNPINTKKELLFLFLVGILYLAFGIALTRLDAKDADVECFSSSSSTTVLDDSVAGFRTDQYQAMYRVLTAFILLAAIITLIPTVLMSFWARRRAMNGDQHMWYAPITQCAWFEAYSKALPTYEKQTTRRQRSRSTNPVPEPRYTEKPPPPAEKPRRQRSQNSTGSLIDHAQVKKISAGGMQNPSRERSRRH